jgi:hypothetical protein
MGYLQCKADPDLWIKDCDTHYEYVLVYVDDLMCIVSHPEHFFQAFIKTYNFKLKGVGTPSYHLGECFCDPDGTLAWGAASYVKKMVMNYEIMFGKKPTKYSLPMIHKDHPELDLSPLLDENGIKQYQSLISALQWLVTLRRFDILHPYCCYQYVSLQDCSKRRSSGPPKTYCWVCREKSCWGNLFSNKNP